MCICNGVRCDTVEGDGYHGKEENEEEAVAEEEDDVLVVGVEAAEGGGIMGAGGTNV
jgi:hypothetical protein